METSLSIQPINADPLRIAHVVALYSRDGAYGGPTRVAIAQAKELQRMGHEVVIFAGWSGDAAPPKVVEGVKAVLRPIRQLLPALGFAGQVAPGLQKRFREELSRFDVVHIHLARDLITLPIARMAVSRNIPVVIQSHGMILPSSNALAGPLDAMLTKKVLRSANLVLALSDAEAHDLEAVAGRALNKEVLANGVSVPGRSNPERPGAPEVIYLARLHARKRPVAFVEAAVSLAREWPTVRFTLVGPDGGEGIEVKRRIRDADLNGQLTWEGPIDSERVLERLRMASVYVLPALGEPFGLTLLEAMSVELPVVLGSQSTLAPQILDAGAGAVFTSEESSLRHAIDQYLRDPKLARRAGAAGRDLVERQWSISAVATKLEGAYRSLRADI